MSVALVTAQMRDALAEARSAVRRYGHSWDVADALEAVMTTLAPLLETLPGYGYRIELDGDKLVLIASRSHGPACGHQVGDIPQTLTDCATCQTYVQRSVMVTQTTAS